MAYSGTISRVMPDSIADEIGLESGDHLLAVDEENIRDTIDLSFALAEDRVEILYVQLTVLKI